jgi:hypothetical protein
MIHKASLVPAYQLSSVVLTTPTTATIITTAMVPGLVHPVEGTVSLSSAVLEVGETYLERLEQV